MANTWPKKIPELSPEQITASEAWMQLWHEVLPKKYGVIEKFNHGYPAAMPVKKGSMTLEIGAGLGEHAKWEDVNDLGYKYPRLQSCKCSSSFLTGCVVPRAPTFSLL